MVRRGCCVGARGSSGRGRRVGGFAGRGGGRLRGLRGRGQYAGLDAWLVDERSIGFMEKSWVF